jgi:tetratricopeptide (TPR) repeat protein
MINLKRSIPYSIALLLIVGFRPAPVLANKQVQYQGMQQWCMEYLDFNKKRANGQSTTAQIQIPPGLLSGVGHYCSAIDAYQKLQLTINTSQQNHLLDMVLSETGYVIGHNPESHPLTAELYALRGRAQLMVKQNAKAEDNLLKALRLDPEHVDVYGSLGNLYLNTNRKAKATETTRAGLGINPQHKALLRLAKKLDIKTDEFQVAKEQPSSAKNPDELKQPAVDVESGQGSEKPAAIASPLAPLSPIPAIQVADETTAKADEKTNNVEVAIPKGGTAKNPWCRFCPESQSQTPNASTPVTTPKAVQ